MKAVILGGCADMAVPLISALERDNDFDGVLLADIDEHRARRIASTRGGKFSAARCDAEDPTAVACLVEGYDVAFGFVGPFYRFEKSLARCAIDARTPYVSIADDYDAYLDVMTLDLEARQAGVKVLTGWGNSPGLTQALARKGYNEVAEPYRVNVHWCAGSDESVGPSNLMHLFHIFNGTTLQTLGGREVRVPTGAGRKLVDFPAPIGTHPVYYTGHAESVSLPRNLSGLEEVTLHGGTKPDYIVTLVKAMRRLRLLDTHRRRAALAHLFHRIEGWFASPGMDRSVGRVEVYGRGRGRPQVKVFTYVGHIAEITSYPAYLGAKWLLQGKLDARPGGVYAAERLLEDPTEFLKELGAMGVEIREEPLREITGTQEPLARAS